MSRAVALAVSVLAAASLTACTASTPARGAAPTSSVADVSQPDPDASAASPPTSGPGMASTQARTTSGAAADTTLERPDLAPLLNRTWRVAAWTAGGPVESVANDYTNTLTFKLESDGIGTVRSDGCIREKLQITFHDDHTFLVGSPVGTGGYCANALDEGQHVLEALMPGATVRWAINNDGRLTLTSAAGISVVYD